MAGCHGSQVPHIVEVETFTINTHHFGQRPTYILQTSLLLFYKPFLLASAKIEK